MSDKLFEVVQSLGTFAVAVGLFLHLLGHIKGGDK